MLAWGLNEAGQLGTGDTTSYLSPIVVNRPFGLRASSARIGDFSVAVNSSGLVYAWGEGEQGELGNGAFTGHLRPMKVRLPSGVKVVSASAGLLHALAQTTTGKVLAWGDNLQGQLGDGTRKQRNVPVWVHLPKIAHVVSIAAGRYHALALTRSGFLLGWGDDAFGQMGEGGFADKLVPTRIFVPANRVIAIGAGPEAYDSMAIVDELVA